MQLPVAITLVAAMLLAAAAATTSEAAITYGHGQRFTPVRKAVIERWEKAASNIDEVVDHRSNTLLLDLVVNWREFSCALLGWSRHGEWTSSPGVRDVLPRFGVTTAQGALATVNAILQPTRICVQ